MTHSRFSMSYSLTCPLKDVVTSWKFLVLLRRYLYEMGKWPDFWKIFALAYAIVGDVHITGWIFPACLDVFPIEGGGDFRLCPELSAKRKAWHVTWELVNWYLNSKKNSLWILTPPNGVFQSQGQLDLHQMIHLWFRLRLDESRWGFLCFTFLEIPMSRRELVWMVADDLVRAGGFSARFFGTHFWLRGTKTIPTYVRKEA